MLLPACKNVEIDDHDHNHEEHVHTGSLWEKIFHNHDDEHNHDHGSHSDEHAEDDASIFISAKKQQTLGIETTIIENSSLGNTSEMSFTGKIERSAADEVEVIAPIEGQMKFSRAWKVGDLIKKGTKLFTISGKGFVEGNIERDRAQINSEIEIAKANLSLAEKDFKRAEKAIEFQVISRDKFEHTKSAYQQAKSVLSGLQNKLVNVGQKFGSSSQSVIAKHSGLISAINQNSGAYTQAGTTVFKISKNQNLIANFQVSTSNATTITSTNNAIIVVNNESITINDFWEKATILTNNSQQIGYTILQVELSQTDKIPVNAIAVLTIENTSSVTATGSSNIKVPKAAVLEDFGLYYCYVETTENHFEQRPLEISERFTNSISIKNGLSSGEKIVTKNPLQVKFSGVAAVGHSHDH